MSNECKEVVEAGMSSVCFVVLLRDDTDDGVDVLACCCETKSTLMPSVRTQKILSDVRALHRMIRCLLDKICSDVTLDVQNFLLLGLLYR